MQQPDSVGVRGNPVALELDYSAFSLASAVQAIRTVRLSAAAESSGPAEEAVGFEVPWQGNQVKGLPFYFFYKEIFQGRTFQAPST